VNDFHGRQVVIEPVVIEPVVIEPVVIEPGSRPYAAWTSRFRNPQMEDFAPPEEETFKAQRGERMVSADTNESVEQASQAAPLGPQPRVSFGLNRVQSDV
jgi:hypothetical protein